MFVTLVSKYTTKPSTVNFKEPRFNKFYSKQSSRKHISYPRTSLLTFIFILIIQIGFTIYKISNSSHLESDEKSAYITVQVFLYTVLCMFWYLCLKYEKKRLIKRSTRFEMIMVVIWTLSALFIDVAHYAQTGGIDAFGSSTLDYLRTGLEFFLRFYMMAILFKNRMSKVIYALIYVVVFAIIAFVETEISNALYLIFVAGAIAFLFLFEDGVSKEEAHRYYCVRQEAKKHRGILWNLSESVLILEAKGAVKFFNAFMRSILMFDGKVGEKLDDDFYSSFGDLNYREYSQDYTVRLSMSSVMLTNVNLRTLKSKPSRKFSMTRRPTLNGQAKEGLIETIRLIRKFEDLVGFFVDNADAFNSDDDYFFIFDTKFTPKDSNLVRSIEVRASIFADGENTQIVFLFRDTTERDMIATLENDNKIYRNNVLASFSHELRTPLNASLGFLEQSLQVPEISKRAKETLIQPAIVSNKLLLSLVNDILDFSQIVMGKLDLRPYSGDMKETIENVVKLFLVKAKEKGISLTANICKDIPVPIYIDHQRISQILVALLSNAMKYTSAEGSIQVIVEKIDNSTYDIGVIDTGLGIQEEDLERIQANLANEQLKKINIHSSGIGLGLFISNALAKRITGSVEGIKIESTFGKGTKSYMTIEHDELLKFGDDDSIEELEEFPSTTQNDCTPMKIKDYTTDFDAKKKIKKSQSKHILWSQRGELKAKQEEKILIVDDEIFNILVLENYCKDFRVPTERAFNGKEAIEKIKLLKENGIIVKVLFLDVNMPIMDGYETSLEINRLIDEGELHDIAIIGVTAYVSPETINKCYMCGFSEVLNKPVSRESVRTVLKNYGYIS